MRNITPQEKERRLTTRRGLVIPRRRFKGCLATKIQPEDYEQCLDNYDDPMYDNIKLVPTALKDRVYRTTQDVKLRDALAVTVNSRHFSASDIRPKWGLSLYCLHFF